MRRSAGVALVLGAALLAATGWWLAGSSADGSEVGAAATRGADPGPARNGTAIGAEGAGLDRAEGGRPAQSSEKARPAQQAFAPLPPVDVPLSEVVDALRERARHGDASAACRLASEFELCAQVRSSLAQATEQARAAEENLQHTTDEAARERIRAVNAKHFAAVAERALADARHCEGVVLDSPHDRVAHWRQAALAGDRAALRHYAVGNAFRWNSLVDTAELLPRYRAEAEQLALRAAAAGDGAMVLALANAYSPIQRELSMNFLAQSVREDPAAAVALLRFALAGLPESDQPLVREARRTITRKLDELLPTLDDTARATAEARFAGYLHDWARPEPPSPVELSMLNRGGLGPVGRDACGKPIDAKQPP